MVKRKKQVDIWIPPKRCPLMNECKEVIAWDSFTELCNSDNWIFCEKATELAKKYKRKPYEWKLVHELGGWPEETIDPKKGK